MPTYHPIYATELTALLTAEGEEDTTVPDTTEAESVDTIVPVANEEESKVPVANERVAGSEEVTKVPVANEGDEDSIVPVAKDAEDSNVPVAKEGSIVPVAIDGNGVNKVPDAQPT